jgi:hydrogenase maturation protease
MNHALVLACGNPLHGDDGVAFFIARYLRAGFCDSQTEIKSFQRWTPEPAEAISESELVLFLEASGNLRAGEVQLRAIQPAGESSAGRTQLISPESLLALARQLYGNTPEQAFVITIGGESFNRPDEFSEPVRLAIPEALNQIKALLSGVSLPKQTSHAQSMSS